MNQPDTTPMRAAVSGSLRVALAALIWGAAYPLTKLVLADTPPILLGFLRFLLAGLFFMVSEQSLPLRDVAQEDRKCFIKLAFWGVFLLVLGMNFGLVWAPGIAASLLSGTPPLFTVVLAAIYLGEKLRLAQFVSIGLALSGLALLGGDVSTNQAGLLPWQIWVGCLLTLVPQFSWAMYGITGKRLSERYHWRTICRDTFTLGALMLLPLALIEVTIVGFGSWNWQTVAILFYLALFNSVVTYSLWNSALKKIPVSLASFLIYLQPVSGAVLSYFIFGESLGWAGVGGTALIFAALTLVLLPETRGKAQIKTTVAQNPG
ncbi:MAG: EamA family transporter [Candidatus Riflebacteria bacterium]|nr:EamA family transporter [Candidatus Riflebacteria bacterium]